MSRVANNPVTLPSGVEVKQDGSDLTIKGGKGTLALSLVDGIQVSQDDNVLTILMTVTSSRPWPELHVHCLTIWSLASAQAGRRNSF